MASRRIINLTLTPPPLGTFVDTGVYNAPPPTQSFVSEVVVGTNSTTLTLPASIPSFGAYPNSNTNYPNDSLQLNVYNAVNQYLETKYRTSNFSLNNNEVTVNVEQDIADLGYITGKYLAEYRFIRNYIGSFDGPRLQVQEISSNGLEVRLVPEQLGNSDLTSFYNYFETGFFSYPKSIVLPNLFLFKNATAFYGVFDYVQDPFTTPQKPYSIIFKLLAPVTPDLLVGDSVWIGQEVSTSVVDEITITPPRQSQNLVYIAGPNWNALKKTQFSSGTDYKDWDDLLSTNTTTAQDVVNKLLSGSLVEGIELNVDFRKFDNFIMFGSARERLLNFRYKMQLLEQYDSTIQQLTTGLNGLLSSSATSSQYYISNVSDTRTKRGALLGGFDSYEKYLYYESSSYESSSYGEFYPTTWPKSNSSKPYVNYPVTSSQAEDWFEGILESASLFDINNTKALRKITPEHILLDPSNEEYVLLVDMVGHYFDLIYAYIAHISKIYNRDQSLLEGFSKDVVFQVASSLGIDFTNGTTLEDLWSYALGTDQTGSLSSTYGVSSEYRTKEIWKRVINNLPYLLKTKGTERGIRALINCFGIPATILRIREYGGVEPEFDTKTDFVFERFFYALKVGYNGKTTDPAAQLIAVPWQPLTQNSKLPMSVEMRVKMAANQTKEQRILEVPDKWLVKAFQSASGNYIGFFLNGSAGWATASVSSSIYDGTPHLICLQRTVESDATSSNQTYNLIVKKTNYEKVVGTYTASLSVNGSVSGSYNQSFIQTSSLWIPGSGSFAATNSSSATIFTGSIQEFRYWTKPLQNSILDNHALAPTSFQGNTPDTYTGSTSSYYDLGFRLCLGADTKRVDFTSTSSLASQHPNPFATTFSGSGFSLSASFFNFSGSLYESLNENHSLEWPDLGANRSVSNKIRIDSTTLASNQLYYDRKIERSLTDQQPPDSPRLGVYLSPQNEINQDIAEQFGGLSIDDFIGDPSYLTLDTYPGLDKLKYEYSKKFTSRNPIQNYIRLIKHFDASLFELIKKMVPHRANTQVGLVIEPTIIERSKVAVNVPTFENLTYTASIDIPEIYTVGGSICDGDGDPFRDMSGYVQEGVIDSKTVIDISGTPQQIIYDSALDDVSIPITYVQLGGNPNEFNNSGLASQPTGEIDFGISSYGRDIRVLGSQYEFYSFATSGSGSTRSEPYRITSSRYDYSEGLNPVILSNTKSDISNITNNVYDTDIYGNSAFQKILAPNAFSASVTFDSVAKLQSSPWTLQYGLKLQNHIVNGTQQSVFNGPIWSLGPANGLRLAAGAGLVGQPVTSSFLIDAFFYDTEFHNPYKVETLVNTHDLLYQVDLTLTFSNTNKVTLYYGDFNSPFTQSINFSANYDTNFETYNYSFVTRATGNYLGFKTQFGVVVDKGGDENKFFIRKLAVKCLNYRAEVQDFHLQYSKGMVNARYEGCKLTSPDYNVDSNDTIDRGPVITITPMNPNQLTPNARINPTTAARRRPVTAIQ